MAEHPLPALLPLPACRSAGFIGEMRDALLQLAAQRDAVPGGGGSAAAALASPAPRGEVADVAVKGSPKAEAAVGWQVGGDRRRRVTGAVQGASSWLPVCAPPGSMHAGCSWGSQGAQNAAARRWQPAAHSAHPALTLFQVSVLFDGDGQWYRGEVLAYNSQRGRHLVLYEDGEDEWLALERESLAWHKLAPSSAAAACPGIRPGGRGGPRGGGGVRPRGGEACAAARHGGVPEQPMSAPSH